MNDDAADFIRDCGLEPSEFEQIVQTQKIPPNLLLGLVKTESAGEAGAMRYEPNYPYLFHVEHFATVSRWTVATETELQRFSWGLCQIMLATARERGFGLHPARLLEPTVGLTWGAYHLSELYLKHKTWPAAVSAYNQGTPKKSLLSGKFKNQAYVDRVYKYAGEFSGVPSGGVL